MVEKVRTRYTSEAIRFPIGSSRDVPPGVAQHWVRIVPTADGKDMELELILVRFETVPISSSIQDRVQ